MTLTFESIQDAIEKDDPDEQAIMSTLDQMHGGLTVKFAQHYHDEWVADYRSQGGVQQSPRNQYSELLEMDTTLNSDEQQMLYDDYTGPAREAVEAIAQRVKEHFSRSRTALNALSTRYWEEAEDLEDSYASTHQDTVKQELQYWEGPTRDLVKDNFASPLGSAFQNHRDMLKDLSNTTALDLALLKKGQAVRTGDHQPSGGSTQRRVGGIQRKQHCRTCADRVRRDRHRLVGGRRGTACRHTLGRRIGSLFHGGGIGIDVDAQRAQVQRHRRCAVGRRCP